MLHRTQFITELRELPPENGWFRAEGTGRACLVCPCGLNTGWLPFREADQLRMQHGTPSEEPCRSHPGTPITVEPNNTGAGRSSFLDIFRWARRRRR